MSYYHWFQVTGKWFPGELLKSGKALLPGSTEHYTPEIVGPRLPEPIYVVEGTHHAPPKAQADGDAGVSRDKGKARPSSSLPAYTVANPRTDLGEEPSKGCGVFAVSRLLNIPIKQARIKALHAGFTSSSGIDLGAVESILEAEGLFTEDAPEYVNRLASKVTFPPNECYVIYTKGHVMPVVNGQLLNLAGSQYQQIESACRIVVKTV